MPHRHPDPFGHAGLSYGSPSIAARISAKIHGIPCRALPTIIAGAAGLRSIESAFSPLSTSPLPITGMPTAATTSAMTRQSACSA
jgi:hypothetical protein